MTTYTKLTITETLSQSVPMTQAEIDQWNLDQTAAVAEQTAAVAEQTRINGLKASIAAKRMASTWQPFSAEEAAYLNSIGQ